MDTSVLVAGLRSPSGASRRWLDHVLGAGGAIISVPLALEYEDVVTRPSTLAVAGLDHRSAVRFVAALVQSCEETERSFIFRPAVSDPNDEMVLEAAISGGADAIVTFNIRDFAGAAQFGIRVLRPGPALEELRDD